MSFIITTISPENAVQISDTRISSLADQSLISDEQRKSLIVRGKKEAMLVPPILSPEGCSTGGTIRTVVSGDEVIARLQAKIARKKVV